MNAIVKGNAVVAQSGGPTTVINSSACGVIEEALRHRDQIPHLFGANNGILGILNEDLFRLDQESPQTIAGLRQTPAAAIGSCRYKLGNLGDDRSEYQRILDVFAVHDIHYFFYIGGNDSMDTADKILRLAAETGYELGVMGVPKTIDNDLVGTDHCPGYGSVIKYLATCVMEAGRDTESLHTFDPITITEAMGRNTGWIAAGTGLAQRVPEDAPHLVYVPEVPFSLDQFLGDIEQVYAKWRRAVIVVSEGVVDENGDYIAAQQTVDAFGHRQLGGVAAYLQQFVMDRLKLKCRYNKLDTCQRSAMHFASKTDCDEAYRCGAAAVAAALQGKSGFMAGLSRISDQPYRCEVRLTPLAEAANGVKKLPLDFLNASKNHISKKMRNYAEPLIQGQAPLKIGADGLPEYVRFQRRPAPPRLAAFTK